MSQAMSQNENATPRSSVYLMLFGRGERIRTSDLTVPNRALYQAEPRPDNQLKAIWILGDAES